MVDFIKMKYIFLLFSLFTTSSYSQISLDQFYTKLDFRAGERFDYSGNNGKNLRNRMQELVQIRFLVEYQSIEEATKEKKFSIKLVGVAGTGAGSNAIWTTNHTFNDNSIDPGTINIRNLYIESSIGKKVTMAAGAIPDTRVVGSAGIGGIGWLDAANVKFLSPCDDCPMIGFTLGSLIDLKNPKAGKREFDPNYVDFVLTKKVFQNLVLESGYRIWEENQFIYTTLSGDVTPFADRVFSLYAGVMQNITDGSGNAELGVEFDFFKVILNKYEKKVQAKIYYSYMGLSSNSELIPLAYGADGHVITGQIDYIVSKNIRFAVRAGKQIEDDGNGPYRFNAGITVTGAWSNSKKK
jgi:hypothetical protein